MSGSFFTLNQKYNNLRTQISAGEDGGGGGGGGSYIDYPVAQGAVTLLDTTVQGNLVISNARDKITFGDSDNDRGIVIGTTTTAPNCNTSTSVIIGGEAGRYLNGTVFSCVAVGDRALQNNSQNPTTKTEYYNTAIGSGSLLRAVNSDSSTLANSGCGFSTLSAMETGSNNSGFGSESGVGNNNIPTTQFRYGSSNTFLGAKTGLDSALSYTCNHSTAVGADALCTASNQVRLGTATDEVSIPNLIRFSDNTTLSTASAVDVGMVSIITYGAIGNGIFDCTTAINNAITALGSGGKTLYIPQGEYLVSGQLTFDNLTNAGVFCQGTLQVGTNDNFSVIYISNTTNLSFSGCLRITNPTPRTGITGIKIDDVIGYNQNFNLNTAIIKNVSTGILVGSGSFNSRVFSNLNFSSCDTSINCQGEYNLFTNVSINGGTYGIINYGGNNEYNGGFITQTAYGVVVAYVPDIVGNPDHGGLFNFVINHNTSIAIFLYYINASWVISNCNIYANDGDPIGNPLGVVPASYQVLNAPAVYLQGCTRVNISNCVFGFNPLSLMINGVIDSVITNNVFFQNVGDKYISINGLDTYGENTNNIITNNEFSGLGDAGIRVEISNAINGSTLAKTSSTIINNNNGGVNLVNFNNTGTGTTRFIDGTVEFYNIYEGQTDTIYLANVNNGSQFTINYIRNLVTDFTQPPTSDEIILLNNGFGGTNSIPVVCDGLMTSNIGGVRSINFYKGGSYMFQPTINGVKTSSGFYTIYPTTKDPHLYFAPTLQEASLDLSSPLYYNTVVNVQNGVVSPDTTITIPDAVITTTTPEFSYVGSTLQIFNNTSYALTLSRPVGSASVFAGAYGNGGFSIVLPDNVWYTITFDGTNYLINERSSEITFSNTGITSSPVTYTGNYNYTNATLRLASTATNTVVNWLLPTDSRSHNTTTKIVNVGTTSLILTLSATTFIGKYGSGTTTLTIPPNNFIEIFSNGVNWLVQERSNETFNMFLLGNGGTLDWSSSPQYLDGKVEFVQPDSTLISPPTTFTGNATQSGYIITTTGVTGTITAGSVLTLAGRRMIIRSQISGTSGGNGTYFVNYSQTVSPAVAFSNGYSGTGSLSTGILTINTSQTTNFATATISGAVNVGTTIGVATGLAIAQNPFYIMSGTGGGNCDISTGVTLSQSNVPYYATSGTTITLPSASGVVGTSSTVGRTVTIINNGNNPINIIASGGTSLFTGFYGQILSTGVYPNKYFLRPSETVVLKSDGTNWETQTGTTLGGARGFVFVSTIASSQSERALNPITAWNTLDSTYSNLTGLVNTSGIFYNVYPFTITVNVAVVLTWSNPTGGAGVTTTSPQRIVQVVPNNAGTGGNGTSLVQYQNYPFVLTQATGTMTPSVFGITQTINGLFTLKPYESITINFGKVNGSATTPESLGSGTVFINRVS